MNYKDLLKQYLEMLVSDTASVPRMINPTATQMKVALAFIRTSVCGGGFEPVIEDFGSIKLIVPAYLQAEMTIE